MNDESKLDIFTAFADYRTFILQVLKLNKVARDTSKVKSYLYLTQLMDSPVSKLSKFSDSKWDFNLDYPNAARNIKGAKLKLDFLKYPEIPKFVLIELKVLFELVYINNRAFSPQGKGGKSKNKGTLKANTLIQRFSYGLSFVDALFKQAAEELGKEYVQNKIETLSDVLPEHYYKAAANYNRVKGSEINIFFSMLRNPMAQKYVFSKPISYVELDSLPWKKKAKLNENKNPKEQVIPDIVFEKLSKDASLIVVDFLSAIGGEISDKNSLERLQTRKKPWSSQQQFNQEIFTAYTAIRLRTVGYKHEDVVAAVSPYEWMLNKDSKVLSGGTLRKRMKARGYDISDLRGYITLVIDSCIYIVGQYTGMRPSELAEIIVENEECLSKENGVWIINSAVKKHVEEENRGLFDDKWVAIPIVRDAIKVASKIAKLKANPYLLSNIDTCRPDKEPQSMTSTSVTYQMDRFISLTLGKGVAEIINFNPYMMRHTLAYQLFRAEVGLPLISFQLKHFVDDVARYTSIGSMSQDTLGYGEIGEMISKDGFKKSDENSLRKKAEFEIIKSMNNPNGVYYGGKATEHKARLRRLFDGCIQSGYSEEEVFAAMVEQGIAIAYLGQGMCYGGRNEEFDESLPCIGSLRCNPARCAQAVVTKQHAPKWREVYVLNKTNLNKPEYVENHVQIRAAMNEARMVLEHLNEAVEL